MNEVRGFLLLRELLFTAEYNNRNTSTSSSESDISSENSSDTDSSEDDISDNNLIDMN